MHTTVRVLLLGDSTVWGSYPRLVAPAADHLEDVIRKRLAGEEGVPPVEVINRGEDNDTIQRMLGGRYDRDVRALPAIHHVFIRYGVNDRSYLADFETDFRSTYRELLARLRRDHPAARMTMETIIPYRDEASTREVNAVIREIAAAEGLPVLDTHARYAEALKAGPHALSYRLLEVRDVPRVVLPLLPAGAIVGDKVCLLDNLLDAHLADIPGWFDDRHPNPAGYHVIGEGIARYLLPLLRGGTQS